MHYLKPGSVYNFEHLVFSVQHQFFCIEPKFTLAELGRKRQYPGETLDAYMKRFHEKALDCSNPMTKDVLVEICRMIKECKIYLEKPAFFLLFQVKGCEVY